MHPPPQRRARRLVVGLALTGALVPSLFGGTPAEAQASATSGWFVYHYEPQPAPVSWRCALGNDTATRLVYSSGTWYVVANSHTKTTQGGMCVGPGYYAGWDAIRSQSALIYWVNGQPTLCSLSPNAYSRGSTQALAAAVNRCGNGQYSSTSFHDVTFSGVHRTSMMATQVVTAP
jgi:hypothetical protein